MLIFGPPNVEKLKAKGDVRGLVKALGYLKDVQVQSAAATALADIGSPAVQPLVAALGNMDAGVRRAAAATLRRIGGPVADEALEALAARNEELAARAVIERARGLAGDTLKLMEFVGEDIKKLEGKGYVRALVWVMSSTTADWAVRSWAAQALGRLGDVRAVDPLLRATGDPHWGVVSSAAEALGNIGDLRATDRLKELLTWVPGAAPVGAVREFVGMYRNAPQMSAAFEAAAASGLGQAQAEDVQKAAREALQKMGREG